MVNPAQRRATYDDLLKVPKELVAELVRDELITHPRPALPHANVASNLGGELHGPFRRGKGGPGGWILLDEPELHLHGDVLVPDLAGWRRERAPILPRTAAFDLAPDWVCEVLSAGTEAFDRADKMPIYARETVTHVWLVDPLLRTLEIFKLLGDGKYQATCTYRDDAVVHAEPFEAIALELAALWAE